MELKETIQVSISSTQSSPDEQQELVKCVWKKCKPRHKKDIDYRNNGCTLRPVFPKGSGSEKKLNDGHPNYWKERARWEKAEPAPWQDPRYHHLIPIACMAKFADLSHNAKLSGYDINHPTNIMVLPSFDDDAEKYDTQAHRGNHKSYSAYADNTLAVTEDDCKMWCQMDSECTSIPQSDALIARLDFISRTLRTRIKTKKISLK